MVKTKLNLSHIFGVWGFLIAIMTLLTACGKTAPAGPYEVVPLPQEITLSDDAPFILNSSVEIGYPAGDTLLARNAEFLSDYLSQSLGYKLNIKELYNEESTKGCITLTLNPGIEESEGYILTTTSDGITIEGQTPQGVFYGIQTLRKTLPATAQVVELPAGRVVDAPRFGYRSMHLDCSRHFFPIEFVKKYIDLLAMHNMNNFHWHLTDDQGWRIEMEKYPKLNEVAAWRNKTVVGYAGSGEFDNERYGGYYTKEELREVVAYARERYINIVPEVDMPGHMLAALAAYPELGCTGGPYEVSPDWGVFDDVLCIGNDATFEFLEAVVEEVIEIFPSKYIHIGGDECPRIRWHECPKCQARIKAEGLKAENGFSAEDALQSYTTHRIEKFLNERGRTIIGWDEILRGELAPNAVVMSWQGTEGGIQAARMGHKVIMAPNSYCYFDYYQTADTENEPLSIGGCLTVEKVYSFEPATSLSDKQAEYIMGVQANVWTEYIHTTDHVEYMVLPRMAALSEVQWTQKGRKDYPHFLSRLVKLMKLYERDRLRYGKHIFELTSKIYPDQQAKAMMVEISSIDDAPIYYTLDGTEPGKGSMRYNGPIAITGSSELRGVAIRSADRTREVKCNFDFNKATLSDVKFLTTQPYPNYTFSGASMLVDGLHGDGNFASGRWLGFVGDDVTAVVDLGKSESVQSFAVTALTYLDAWIMAPTSLTVYASEDGDNFVELSRKEFSYDTDTKKHEIVRYAVDFAPTNCRYLRMVLASSKVLPPGHAAAGSNCFLFIDEIEVK